jgi:tetratricopeptide (TPR) repeat protein
MRTNENQRPGILSCTGAPIGHQIALKWPIAFWRLISVMDQNKVIRWLVICAGLSALTAFTFWPVLHSDFVNFDDNSYVTQNPCVLGGLTPTNIAWAFKTAYFGNWHPLTWLSHMLDVELFGLNPSYHHLTNLLLHICNTCLLFWFLNRATARTWPSAIVAAFFAVHPLHVESVAWVSERKDVLSTFFGLLSLLAYLRYVGKKPETRNSKFETNSKFQIRSGGYFIVSVVFFALGLMSKAMIVTLPFLMLLLDFWPFGRVASVESGGEGKFDVRCFLSLLREKIPYFALTFFFTVISSQVLAASSTNYTPPSTGNLIANVFISYQRYLGKAFWPVNLSAFYPRLATLPALQVWLSAATIISLSLLALFVARRRPYAFVGWFWFIGTLVPVIALPYGDHSMADRYTYVPLIGLFIAIIWTLAELIYESPLPANSTKQQLHEARGRHTKTASSAPTKLVLPTEREKTLDSPVSGSRRASAAFLVTTAILLIGVCSLLSRRQLKYWRGSKELLERALAVSGDSAMVHNNLAALLMVEGNWPEAEKHLTEALRLQPAFPAPRVNLARVLAHEGKSEQAVKEIEALSPEWKPEGYRLLGETFLSDLNTNAAIEQYTSAVQVAPTNAALHETLGVLLAREGKLPEATREFTALVQLRPDAQAHYQLALSLLIQGKAEEASTQYREAIRLKPDWPEPLNDLAWLLATYPRAELRDGAKAVELAERACKLTNFKEARFLGTLDAAYAEAGRFPEAITTAEQAKSLAQAEGDKAIANLADERLKLYRAGLPFRQN